MNAVVDILKGAQEFVSRGWVQYVAQRGERVCTAQALSSSITELGLDNENHRWEFNRSAETLMKAIQEQYGPEWGSIPQWNDAPGRTQEEVIDTFDHAIKIAERDQVGA